MKKTKMLLSMLLLVTILFTSSSNVWANSIEGNTFKIRFYNEDGKEINVSKNMVTLLLEQLERDGKKGNDNSISLFASCSHVPCNSYEGTVISHVEISPTQCWVYTMRAIICKCCNAPIKKLSDWVFSYSHPAH